MADGLSEPGQIHLRIIEVMKRFPAGISGGQIRQELEKKGLRPEDQTHLDRRKRDLKKWFVIEKIKTTAVGGGKKRIVTLYVYRGKKGQITDEGQICQSFAWRLFIPRMVAARCVEKPLTPSPLAVA